MSDEPTIKDFLEAQAHFQLPSLALVQKDWHVVRAMRAIVATDASPFRLIFAGGTCLARAHRLVQRMSEDVDFKIVSDDLVPLSANQRRKLLGTLRDRITETLQAAGFDLGPGDMRSRDANHYTVYNLRYAGSDGAGEQLRPTIQVELNHAKLRRPAVMAPVASFVAEAFQRPPELPAIACVSVTETAAEKLVSLTRRTAMELAGLSRAPDPNLVRHIYDLHAVRAQVDHAEAINLARSIAVSDAEEFANQYPTYLADITGETRKALDVLQSAPAVRARYEDFVAAMVYGEPVAFDTALKTISALVEATWPHRNASGTTETMSDYTPTRSMRIINALKQLEQFQPIQTPGVAICVLSGARVSPLPDPEQVDHAQVLLTFPGAEPIEMIGERYLQLKVIESVRLELDGPGEKGTVARRTQDLLEYLRRKHDL